MAKKPRVRTAAKPSHSVETAEIASEAAPARPLEEVENIIAGSDVTLHDGSHLLYGEKALVPADLAAFLRERGQAK